MRRASARTSKSASPNSAVSEAPVLLRELAGGTLLLTLNRPESLNALSTQLATELHAAIEDAARSDDVRAVVIIGAGGKAFSAGTDLRERRSLSPEGKWAQSRALWDITEAIRNCPKPVIAAIAGWCLGGGFELALSCDIRIAGESARFGWPEMSLGAYPGGGAAVMLPRIVGIAKAKELLFTVRRLAGHEALSCGLVERLSGDGELAACALQIASAVHAIPAELLGAMKHALGESADLPWMQALQVELQRAAGARNARGSQRGDAP
jgi:enoyl-CoA hydratase/carnithine racemase